MLSPSRAGPSPEESCDHDLAGSGEVNEQYMIGSIATVLPDTDPNFRSSLQLRDPDKLHSSRPSALSPST